MTLDMISSRCPEPTSERGRLTFERLLDAAENLFAERGFEGTSMRAVTQAAGASVSAANYHFGSKDALLRATLLRRVEPVNRLRLERLEQLEKRSSAGPPALEEVLECFLRPGFEVRAANAANVARLRQVAARLYAEPKERLLALRRELFGPVGEAMVAALGRAMPDRSREDLALGFQFAVGVMVHVTSGQLEFEADGLDDEQLLRRMIDFASAGLRAAAPPPQPSAEEVAP